MKKKLMCFVFAVVLCLQPVYLFSDIVLSEDSSKAIKSELTNMLAQVKLLKELQMKQSEDLENWKKSCHELENRLNQALQDLESSRRSVVELRKLTEELKMQLAALKNQYTELCRSLTRQKLKTRFALSWAVVATVAAATEFLLIRK